MTGPDISFTRSRFDLPDLPSPQGPLPEDPPDPADRLHRLAVLVADGQLPLPANLSAVDRDTLLTEVGLCRRARLIRFIARAIASDIHRARTSEREPSDAQEKL